jgi:hypothetical protein
MLALGVVVGCDTTADLLGENVLIPDRIAPIALPAVADEATLDKCRNPFGARENGVVVLFASTILRADALREAALHAIGETFSLAANIKSFDAFDLPVRVGIEVDAHKNGVLVAVGDRSAAVEGNVGIGPAGHHHRDTFLLQDYFDPLRDVEIQRFL